MRQTPVIIAALFGLAAAISILAVLRPEVPKDDHGALRPSIAAPIFRTPSGAAALGAERDSLQRDLAALRGELAELRASHSALVRHLEALADSGGPAPAGDARPEEERDPLPDLELERMRVQEDLVALEDRLAAEAPDSAWSMWAAGEIQDNLERHEIGGARLAETECGATTCRFEFEFDDVRARDLAVGEIPFLLPTEGGGTWFMDPDAPERVVLFADRFAPST